MGGHYDTVSVLLDAGAHRTPLTSVRAQKGGRASVSSPSTRSTLQDGMTPLDFARERKHSEVAALLSGGGVGSGEL